MTTVAEKSEVDIASKYKKVVTDLQCGFEDRECSLTKEYEAKISVLKEEILMLTMHLKIKDRVSGDIISSHLKEKDDITSKLQGVNTQYEDSQKKIKALEAEKQDLLDKVEMISALKDTLDVEIQTKSMENSKLEEEQLNTELSIVTLNTQIVEITTELEKVAEEKKALEEVLEKVTDSFTATSKEKEVVEKALETKIAEYIALEKAKADVTAQRMADLEKAVSLSRELADAKIEITTLSGRLALLEKEKDIIERMRYDIEKDYLNLRASIEKDIKLFHGIPFQAIVNEDEDTIESDAIAPLAKRHERSASASEGEKLSRGHKRSSSMSSVSEDDTQTTPKLKEKGEVMVSASEDEESVDEKKDDKDKKMRKYFSNKKPFTVEFVSEKIKKLRQEDFISAAALAGAFAKEILKNEDGQLSYICSDIGKLKFKYIDVKGKTKTDKNLSHLRAVAFPLIEASVRVKIELERSVLTREPNDVVIGKLLETLEGVSKKNKQFISTFAASLAPKIAYLN